MSSEMKTVEEIADILAFKNATATATAPAPVTTVVNEKKKRGRKAKVTAEATEVPVEAPVEVPVETTTTDKKAPKEKKVKPPKNFGFQVPSTKDREYNSIKFCKYIYEAIKEAKPELLSVEKIRDAYNNLVRYMASISGELYTYMPNKAEKYSAYTFSRATINSGYNLAGIKGNINSSYMLENKHYTSQPQYAERIKKCKEQINEITELWSTLYNLTYPEMSAYLIEQNAKLTLLLSEETLKKEITMYKGYIVDRYNEIERFTKQIESYKKTLTEKEGKLAQLIVNSKRNVQANATAEATAPANATVQATVQANAEATP